MLAVDPRAHAARQTNAQPKIHSKDAVEWVLVFTKSDSFEHSDLRTSRHPC